MARHETGASAAGGRSILSRLSKSKTKEKLPPPTLPIMDLTNSVVGWEGQHDPEMPLNFTPFRKWFIVAMLSTITFMTPFASSNIAPGIKNIAETFHAEDNLTKASMPVSIFLLGYAVGPLFLSPLSEIYGRSIVLLSSCVFFCVWLIGCALAPSLDSLIVFRFLSGLGGSAVLTVGGAIIADIFQVSERGRAMTIWMLGPMVGPSCGPVIGGFVAQTIGWRWVNWISFIPSTLTVIAMIIFSRETNAQVLIERKTKKLRQELNRPELRSCYIDPTKPTVTKQQILLNGLIRPVKMLFQSVMLFSVSIYIAFLYGCLYLLFNTIPIVFEGQYGWTVGIAGLVYLTLLVGYMVSLWLFYKLSDATVVKLTNANGGVYEPEMRLPHCIWFAAVIPASFFWYGWSANYTVHWIVPVLGIVPFGFGIIGVWLPIQAYLIDSFPQYAASALAAFSVLRCAVAAFLPLAGPAMYANLGVGWGTSLLGFIALAMVPIPIIVHRKGKWLRERFPVSL